MNTKILIATLAVLTAPALCAAQWPESAAFERGCEAFAVAQYERAAAEFREVPETAGPVYARARYNLGVCYYELGRLEEAVDAYRAAAAARRGDYPKALYALGVALDDLGRAREAAASYRLALQRAGRYPEAHFRLGLAAYAEARFAAAAHHFRRAAEQRREPFAAARNNLGVALARMGALDEARAAFEAAVAEAPSYADALRNLEACREAQRTARLSALALATERDPR